MVTSIYNRKPKLSKSIFASFQQIAKAHPDKIAIIHQNNKITYAELIKKAEKLSYQLINKGIQADDRIGVFMAPSINRIISIIAIVRLGAAYVPLDPIQPQERRNYICQHAKVRSILVDEKNEHTPKGTAFIVRELLENEINQFELEDLNLLEKICYIIYTSGTTGKPKGVCILQKNVLGLVANKYCVEINNRHRVVHAANFSFDISTFEIWSPLLNGGSLVILDRYQVTSPAEMYAVLKNENINVYCTTPSLFDILYQNGFVDFRMLDYLILGGEPLNIKTIRSLINSSYKPKHVINGFGPTETTFFSLYYEIKELSEDADTIPIGRPLMYENVYILDEHEEAVNLGECGELYISGMGVGLGYVENEKNPNTAFKTISVNGKKIKAYKTGDICKQDHSGLYYFLGRNDKQIKINGFRVEPDEIKNSIEEQESVAKVIVKDFPDNDGKHRFAAYVILKDKDTQKIDAWKKVYESVYSQPSLFKLREDFTGWQDSLTGKNFDAKAMQSWLQNAIENILSMNPKRVLEIGCGNGLILFKIVKHITSYVGIDISDIALQSIDLSLKDQEREKITLLCGSAHQLTQILNSSQSFDVIILNSVVQYFPSIYYFETVLNQCISLLSPNGTIYLGDIRDYSLLELFYARKYSSMDIIAQAITEENELCISPAYFYTISESFKQLTPKFIKKRLFTEPKELSLYRYDVFLEKCKPRSKNKIDLEIIDCSASTVSLEELIHNSQQVIILKNITDERIISELAKIDKNFMRDFRFLENKRSQQAFNPSDLVQKVNKKFPVTFSFCHSSNSFLFHLVLSRKRIELLDIQKFLSLPSFKEKIDLFNHPENHLYSIAATDIFQTLARKLPHYMLPKKIEIMPNFPTNINGKTDLSLFPNPFNEAQENLEIDVVAINLPQMIFKISKGKLKNVTKEDSLIALGMDSLDFLLLISLIEQQYNVRLSLVDILESPDIKAIENKINHYHQLKINTEPKRKKYRNKILPLLPNQIEKYYEHLDSNLKYVNNIVTRIEYDEVKLSKLKNALNVIYEKMSVLRMNVVINNGFFQKISDTRICPLKTVTVEEINYQNTINEVVCDLQTKDIDLENDLLFQCYIISCKSDATLIIYTHHILIDFQSLEKMLNFLNKVYLALNDQKVFFQDNYLNYVQDQYKHVSSKSYKRMIDKIALSLLHKQRELVVPNFDNKNATGDYLTTDFNRELIHKVQQFVCNYSITPFTLYFCVFQLTVMTIFQQTDFTIGITASTRGRAEYTETIGLINNYLIISNHQNYEDSITTRIEKVQKSLLSAFQLIDYNNYDITKRLEEEGDFAKLFNLFFDYNKMDVVQHLDDKIRVISVIPSKIVNRILSVRVKEFENRLTLSIRYRVGIFSRDFVEGFAIEFAKILDRLINSINLILTQDDKSYVD